MERKPRERGETFAGTFILALGLFLAAIAAILLLSDYAADDIPDWLPGTFLGANSVVCIAWGAAILHGGFEGRRYTD